MNQNVTRRSFLRQSFAFSALASGLVPANAFALAPDPAAHHILMIGDWARVR
jgi:tartrate-resistant acid phosphatase type 5